MALATSLMNSRIKSLDDYPSAWCHLLSFRLGGAKGIMMVSNNLLGCKKCSYVLAESNSPPTMTYSKSSNHQFTVASLVVLSRSNADNFGISQQMASIIGAGYLDRQDPFIKNLLNVFRATMLKNLKEKAKIPVKKGTYLLGVVDDSSTLKDGEIFCQVSVDSTHIAPCCLWKMRGLSKSLPPSR